MKIIKIVTLISVLLFISLSCESTKTNEKITADQEVAVAKDVSVKEFKSLIADDVILLDVRRPIEYNAGHLAGSININFFDDDFLQQVSKLDNSKTLLIYCASGGRSSGAMKKIKGSGFAKMYNMLGGISSWQGAGFEVVK